MRFVKLFTQVIIVIIVLACLISLILPSADHLERTTLIEAPADAVFSEVNNLHNATRWIPWGQTDTTIRLHYSQPAVGKNAFYTWASNDKKIPPGKFIITDSKSGKAISFYMEIQHLPSSTGGFIFYPALDNRHTYVKWYMDVKVGWLPWWKFYGIMLDRLAGPAMEQGLAQLKKICETNTAYGIKIEKVKVKERYVATVLDTLLKDQIKVKLPKIYAVIRKFIQQNKISGNDLPIVQYEQLSGDTVAVNAGIPINKQVKGNNKIKIFHMPETNMLIAHYTGPEDKVYQAYEALRNYAAQHYMQSPAAPWQVYVTDTTAVKDTAQWQTDVYYPVY